VIALDQALTRVTDQTPMIFDASQNHDCGVFARPNVVEPENGRRALLCLRDAANRRF